AAKCVCDMPQVLHGNVCLEGNRIIERLVVFAEVDFASTVVGIFPTGDNKVRHQHFAVSRRSIRCRSDAHDRQRMRANPSAAILPPTLELVKMTTSPVSMSSNGRRRCSVHGSWGLPSLPASQYRGSLSSNSSRGGGTYLSAARPNFRSTTLPS